MKVRLTIDLEVGASWREWVTSAVSGGDFQVEADDLVDLLDDRHTKNVELVEASLIIGGNQFR